MQIKEEKDESAVIVSLHGRADGLGGSDLEEILAAIVERGDVNIVLDCDQLTYINSSGLRILFTCARNCKEHGGNLVLAALKPACRSTMEISGFLAMIDCFDTAEDALNR